MFQTKVVEKDKTHILCSITFSRKSCRLWYNVGEYGTARQATDDNIIQHMRFACWITKATDTLRICNTYCFSMATMVTWTRLNVTFVRILPFSFRSSCVSLTYLLSPVLHWIICPLWPACRVKVCSRTVVYPAKCLDIRRHESAECLSFIICQWILSVAAPFTRRSRITLRRYSTMFPAVPLTLNRLYSATMSLRCPLVALWKNSRLFSNNYYLLVEFQVHSFGRAW
jgi:hypothetical protein